MQKSQNNVIFSLGINLNTNFQTWFTLAPE